MNINDVEKVYPNCFLAKLNNEDKFNINILFGKAEFTSVGESINDKDVKILSDINMTKEGLKVVLKRLIDLAEDYNKKYNVNILDEIINDFEEVGEENATS